MKVVIPMAGLGSRFSNIGIKEPKPLIKVKNITLIEHSIRSFDVDAEFIFITRKFENSDQNIELSKLLKELKPNSKEIILDQVTNGATQTVLAAKEFIDTEDELVIYNCDQIIKWNPNDFLSFVKTKYCHGVVVLYNSNDPKNSFAKIKDEKIVKIVEKKPVSDNALIGFHYWKKGSDFVESAEKLISNFHINGQPECYISETYNYLIDNKKVILPYFISNNMYIPLGTPEDVAKYDGKTKEYYSDKPKTIFCDIDGTILKHLHSISLVLSENSILLDGVKKKFDQWDSTGHRIILVTARKESTREYTEQQLKSLGIAWDQLIMGVTNGPRVLINDKLCNEDHNRAISVNVITDDGFDNISWDNYGL